MNIENEEQDAHKQPADELQATMPTSPSVSLPSEEYQAVIAGLESERAAPQTFQPFKSVAWSLGLSIVGALLWGLITAITNYQLGLIAIVIGVLAGFGAAKGGRGRGAQATGAICAALGYFIGQTALVIYLVSSGGIPLAAEEPGSLPPDSSVEQPATAVDQPESPPAQPKAKGFWAVVGLLFWEIVKATFTSFDAIFLAIAVWEGYSIPRAR